MNPSIRGLCAIRHGPAQHLISLPGINGLVVPAPRRSRHLLLAPLWPPGKGIWRGLGGGGGGEAGYPSTLQVLGDLASWVHCNTLLPDSGSRAIATGRVEWEGGTGRDV